MNEAFTTQQTQVDYFYDNFTREGLNYVKFDLKSRIERYKLDLQGLQEQKERILMIEARLNSFMETATKDLQDVLSAIKEKNQARFNS